MNASRRGLKFFLPWVLVKILVVCDNPESPVMHTNGSSSEREGKTIPMPQS